MSENSVKMMTFLPARSLSFWRSLARVVSLESRSGRTFLTSFKKWVICSRSSKVSASISPRR